MRSAKTIKTVVAEDRDELDLRIAIPLLRAQRILEQDNTKGMKARGSVRKAAGVGHARCPITVKDGGDEPVYMGRSGGKLRGNYSGWGWARRQKYRPSTLEVVVGVEWVLKHLGHLE